VPEAVPLAATVAVNVTVWPTTDGFNVDCRLKVVVSFTVCVTTPEVEAAFVASPLYTAVIG
jgi:hypothetical protein